MNEQPSVLIIDDDEKIAGLIEYRLKKLNCRPRCAYRSAEALEFVLRENPKLVLLDIRLPDGDGVEILKCIHRERPETYVIMISAHADIKTAVDCMKEGAYDFIEKPFELHELDLKVRHVFDRLRLEEEVFTLKRELNAQGGFGGLIGKSAALEKVLKLADAAAQSKAHVLIEGESGTGKELVARAIHARGGRTGGPFVAVNCGAIPEHLLESELFGYEKGAFTGAVSRHAGKFEQAQSGTVFLDEIGELSGALQVKLLRVLQEREVERLGGNGPVVIDARFISATNQDLRELVRAGRFRSDLYFRVNVLPIRIPPLRARAEDIPELFEYFRKKHGGDENLKLEAAALKRVLAYEWPGNIRELENFVERLLLLKTAGGVVNESDVLSAGDFERERIDLEPPSIQTKPVLFQDEKLRLEEALRHSGGNISRASKLLQISRDTFYRKLKIHAIER